MNVNAKPTSEDIIEGVRKFREHLASRFGSNQVAFKALDTNGNGNLSSGEIRDASVRLKIDLQQVTGLKDFNKVFSAIDVHGKGGLTIEDLFDNDPEVKEDLSSSIGSAALNRKPTRKISIASNITLASGIGMDIPENLEPSESLIFFRQGLVKKFGSEQAAFKALDTNGNGLLSLGEIKDSLLRHRIKLEQLCGVPSDQLRKIFQLLDIDNSGELSFWELMQSDPQAEQERKMEQKRQTSLERTLRKEVDIEAKAVADKIAMDTFKAEKKAKDEAVLEQAREQPNLPQYVLLRNWLLQKFGSPKDAMKALDTNGNGLLSLGELLQSLQRLHINLDYELGANFDVRGVFKTLDVDASGELTTFELFKANPTEERARLREERKKVLVEQRKERELQEELAAQQELVQPNLSSTITDALSRDLNDEIAMFRRFLIERLGSAETAFKLLDADGSGMISFGELRVSLERLGISVKEAIDENASLMKIFRKLDANKRGEITFEQLMIDKPGTRERTRKKAKKKTMDVGSSASLRELDESQMSEYLLRVLTFLRTPQQKELNLRWGHIGRDGAQRLAIALHNKGQIRQMKLLQLEGNYITSEGLSPLADAIEKFCHLEKLNLSWNALDNQSAELLAFTISKVKQLVELDLSHNHINDQGAEKLARTIGNKHVKSGLKILNMESNLMGRFGIEELKYACSGKKIKFKFQGNVPESTSGCNVKEGSRQPSARSSRPPSSRGSIKGGSSVVGRPTAVEGTMSGKLESYDDVQQAADKLLDPKTLETVEETPHKSKAKLKDFGNKSLQLPGYLQHLTFCWSNDGGFGIPKGDQTKFLLSEARKEAQNIEIQRKLEDETESQADDASDDVTKISVPLPGIGQQPKMMHLGRSVEGIGQQQKMMPLSRSLSRSFSRQSLKAGGDNVDDDGVDMRPQSVGSDSGKSRLGKSVSQGRFDYRPQSVGRDQQSVASEFSDVKPHSVASDSNKSSRAQTNQRDTGIVVDYKQKPAGDYWKVGLELEKTLRNAKLVGLGKASPSLSQSQGSLKAQQRQTGAFAQLAEAWH